MPRYNIEKMELNAFIQSGLLESYVLGQCAPTESALVERMLAQHPEVRAEMDNIEQTLEYVGRAYAVAPPAGLKERILSEINRPPSGPEAATDAVAAPQASRLLPWAMGILLLAAGWLFYQNSTLRRQNQTLTLELTARTQALADCATQNEQKEKIYALLSDTQTVDMKMRRDDTTIPVYFNPQRKEVAFNLSELHDRGNGEYYQLWIIDGKNIKSLGMAHTKTIDEWVRTDLADLTTDPSKTFAVSVEDNPEGKKSPTLPAFMLIEVPTRG